MHSSRGAIFIVFTAILTIACTSETATDRQQLSETDELAPSEFKVIDLLRDTIGLAEGVEVIMTYVEIPENTPLPAHYHPGEEFVYVIEGSGVLILNDQDTLRAKAGDSYKVPLRAEHGFYSEDEGVKVVVFRVHEKGQPDRILIE